MSEFQELIKSFSKTRDYVRDFFVYGFKTREDFSQKSGRTYDNERRRIESWLSNYIQNTYGEQGKTVSIVLNSNLLLTNPLYRVWKSKSFTDNDIMLHFFLMDILQDKEAQNDIFTTKHAFFVHTLEDEILLDLLTAMQEKRAVSLTQQNTKNKHIQKFYGVPLKIFVSTKTGRRYICLYLPKSERFTNLRLDSIKKVTTLEVVSDYKGYQQALERNLPKLFGVSFGNDHTNDWIKITLQIDEKREHFILERLQREGQGGIITKAAPNTFTYEKEVFDGNEMMPWIKTFIGRILSLESNNDYLKHKFYYDIKQMLEMYQ